LERSQGREWIPETKGRGRGRKFMRKDSTELRPGGWVARGEGGKVTTENNLERGMSYSQGLSNATAKQLVQKGEKGRSYLLYAGGGRKSLSSQKDHNSQHEEEITAEAARR